MNNDLDAGRTDAIEPMVRVADAIQRFGVSCRELTGRLDALAYAFQLLNDGILVAERIQGGELFNDFIDVSCIADGDEAIYDSITEENSLELDEFLSCFKVTTEQEVY